MKIEIIKGKYKTKDGFPFTIISIDAEGNYPIKGIVHYRNAAYAENIESLDELVKIPSLEDLKVDDRVLVRYYNGKWLKRHFAKISKSGKCVTFAQGVTSWSAICDDEYSEWDEWKLPSEDN